jgi:glycosyltransferase involved in cell wall biosynthesis
MRVLWFTNTSVDYDETSSEYNGGGWMSALKNEVMKTTDIELAISFYGKQSDGKIKRNTVTYYPISFSRDIVSKMRRFFSQSEQENDHIAEFKKIISDFKPDIIHIFGTEKPFGLVAKVTYVPTIIHLQGLINPYLNALLPPSYSKLDFFLSKGFKPYYIIKNVRAYLAWEKSAIREQKIFSECKYFLGRTHWDKKVSKILSPRSKYFYCSEILRPQFNCNGESHSRNQPKSITIISTISDPLYKGGDLILKTANILKNYLNIDFQWLVYGVDNLKFASSKTSINPSAVSVTPMGIACAKTLKNSLLNATVYLHPSYIDNSPNSICEAQSLGIPVVANNVGGVSSLVTHNKTGFLTPANDPYMSAYFIKKISLNSELWGKLSKEAKSVCLERHNPSNVVDDLMFAYKEILNKR